MSSPESQLPFSLPAETQYGAVKMSEWIRENGWIRPPEPIEHCPPSGWVGTDEVLGWLAFGAALDLYLWDLYFYVGASEWLWWSPELLAQRLERAGNGEVLASSEIGDHLLTYVQGEADEQIDRAIEAAERRADGTMLRELRKIPYPPALEQLGATAGLLAEHIRANLADCERKRAAILEASHTLRRALARGALAAFGRDAAGSARRPARSRKRVPRRLSQTPVTVACEGVFPWECSVDRAPPEKAGASLLYRDLAFDADDVLEVWPSNGLRM